MTLWPRLATWLQPFCPLLCCIQGRRLLHCCTADFEESDTESSSSLGSGWSGPSSAGPMLGEVGAVQSVEDPV